LQHAVNIFFSVVGADDDAEHNNFVDLRRENIIKLQSDFLYSFAKKF